MKLTPKELLDLARSLNPEKLTAHPIQAIVDAYKVEEAIEMANNDVENPIRYVKPSGSSEPARPPGLPVQVPELRGYDPETTVLRLQEFLEKSMMKKTVLAKRLKVSQASLSAWLLGKWKPAPRMVEEINRFLLDAQP